LEVDLVHTSKPQLLPLILHRVDCIDLLLIFCFRDMASGAGKNVFLTRALEKILADRETRRSQNAPLRKACESALSTSLSNVPVRISKSTHKAGGEHSRRLSSHSYDCGSKLCPPLLLLALLKFADLPTPPDSIVALCSTL